MPRPRPLIAVVLLTAALPFAHAQTQPARKQSQIIPLQARRADFATFVQNFRDSYAWRDVWSARSAHADEPWLTWQTRYAAAVDSADTKPAFDTVLATALAEIHDFHAEVRSPVPDRWLPVPTFADLWAEFHAENAIVLAVRAGSDAARASILPGDRILAIGNADAPQTIGQAVAARLSSSTDRASPNALRWALLSVLTGRADEPRTFTVQTGAGTPRTVTLPIERQFDRTPGALQARLLDNKTAYIRFNNSLGDQQTVAAFDQALERFRDAPGLILDLRDTPSGGDSSVALGILGRFTSCIVPYQRHRIPGYGQRDVERNWLELVSPRGPWQYTHSVVVLVDHWTGSMGEGMAIGFDAMQRALVVGTPMAGLAGAVFDFQLPATGADVAYATEQLLHTDGTLRQDWRPPVLVPTRYGTAGTARDTDPVLARGQTELRRLLRAQPSNPRCTIPPVALHAPAGS